MRHHVVALVVSLCALGTSAHADWLTWSSDTPNGNPAITLNAQGAVALTLSDATLAEAAASGVAEQAAVRAFLAHWAPRLCSPIMDMNAPHPKLAVDLFVEHRVGLEDLDQTTLGVATDLLNGALQARPHDVPRLKQVFVVDPGRRSMVIDYAPEKPVKCREPQEAIF
jgi:hypothetical protein